MLKPILKPMLQEIIKPILESIKSVVNYVAKADGFSQYWQLSEPITVPAGGEVLFMARVDSFSSSSYLFDESVSGSGTRNYLFVGRNTRQISSIAGFYDLYLDGVLLDLSSEKFWPNDGLFHEVRIVALQQIYITRFGARFFGPADYLGGVIKDISVTNATALSLPLTNREQGATQLPTVGSISATMPNYTPDVWEVDTSAS